MTHRTASARVAPWLLLTVLAPAFACGDDLPSGADGSTATPDTSTSAATSTSATTASGPTTTAPTSGPSTDTTEGADTTAGEPVPGLSFEPIVIDDPIKRATAMAFMPGRSDVVLMSKDGDVAQYALRGNAATRLGGFTIPGVHSLSDCGAISIAFDPGFAENRLFYVGMCTSSYFSGVYRFTLGEGDDWSTTADSMVEVISVGHPEASNPWHNVGSIAFDDAGNLWAAFGDKTVTSSAQDLSNNLGSLVRIEPDRTPDGSGYTPVRDNPFYGDPDRSWDIYAWGFRSPWKGLFDAQGRYWMSEVGSDYFEEVDLVRGPGQNHGWPVHEGLCDEGDCTEYVDPVTTWPHGPHPYIEDDPLVEPVNARVAWVGAAYEDRGNDHYAGLLTGRVLFGDSCLGYVRAIEVDDDGQVVFDEYLGHIVAPTSWAQGPDGYLYVVSYGGCGSGSNDPAEHPRVALSRVVLAP